MGIATTNNNKRRLIDFSNRKGTKSRKTNFNQLVIGVGTGCYYGIVDIQKMWLPLSCSNSSSSNVVNTNAQRRLERLEQERANVYGLIKARGNNNEGDAHEFSEEKTFPGLFGPDQSSINREVFHHSMTDKSYNRWSMDPHSTPVDGSHHNSNQRTSSATSNTNAQVNKSKRSRKTKAVQKVAKTKLKVVSKKPCAKSALDIISRVIQLERETGCEPGSLDLLCLFSRQAIHAVWDQLIFLYPDLCSKGYTTIPFDVDHRELIQVMA